MTDIYIAEVAGNPGRYSARKDSPTGPLLLTSSRQPLLDSCRVLRGQGIRGRCAMHDASTPYPRAWVDIDKGAKLIVIEDPKGLRFSKFIPFKRPDNIYARGV